MEFILYSLVFRGFGIWYWKKFLRIIGWNWNWIYIFRGWCIGIWNFILLYVRFYNCRL